MKRKVFLIFSCVVLFCGALFLLRSQILVFGTKSLISRAFPEGASYKEISCTQGKIHIESLCITQDRFQVTLGSVDYDLHLGKIFKEPKRLYELYKRGFRNWVAVLVPMKQYGMNPSVENGILQLDDQRYYFAFKKGKQSTEIGQLFISHDPGLLDHPFLLVQFHMRGNQLAIQVKSEEVPSERLLHLASFAFPQQLSDFQNAGGHVELSASVIFEQDGKIDELSTQFNCEDFEVHYPKQQMGLRMESLKGDLNYPEGVNDAGLPVWKKMVCNLNLEGGAMVYADKFSLAKLEGNLSLDPREDPHMLLKGELMGQEDPLALTLQGNGAIHEDHAYWLEFNLNLEDRLGTDCEAFLSLCRPQFDSLVGQMEARHLLPGQVEMLKGYFARFLPRLEEWKVAEGSFGGKLVAFFEGGNLSHFEIEELLATDVALTKGEESFRFSKIKGEGRLFDTIDFDIDLFAHHFFGFLNPDWKEIYTSYHDADPAHLSTHIKFGKKGVETTGSIDFLNLDESLQFGFTSSKPFPETLSDVKEGWVRSEKLTQLLYSPFVRAFDEDLEIYGDFDLLATYQGKKVEIAVQAEEFLMKHPRMDLKANTIGEKGKNEGRAKLVFEPSTGKYQGTVPFVDGLAYDRTFGLALKNIQGEVTFSEREKAAEIKSCDISFDQKPLLHEASFSATLGADAELSGLRGQLALPTDKIYHLSIFHLTSNDCSFALFDGKKQLCHFNGKKEENWEGAFTVNGLPKKMETAFSWEGKNASLSLSGNEMQLYLKKEGEEFIFEAAEKERSLWKGVFSRSEEGFALPHFEMEQDNLLVSGGGKFFIDLPSSEQNFGLRTELHLEAEVAAPIPMKVATKQPVKFAYSPEKGFLLSGLELETEGSFLHISQLEHLFSHKKTEGHISKFFLAQPLLEKLISVDILPGLLKDFRFGRNVKGEATFQQREGVTHLSGVLEEAATWKDEEKDLQFTTTLEKGKCNLTLKEETDALSFTTSLDKGNFTIESVKGSLGRMEADLVKTSKGLLKGKLKLDFSLFDQLFSLPLTRLLNLWHAGGGYLFDGVFTPQKDLANWGFKGKMKGEGFECGGYELRSVEAKIEVEPGQIAFENLDLTDDAGKLWIGEGALMRSGQDWVFSFPLVEIRGFQPSFLHKAHGKESSISPLTIKTATVENMRGKVDDPQSITGSGTLRFTNKSKEGEVATVRNLPRPVLDQLGLNGSLFVPISGEMDFILQNGRIYLRSLRNVISDQALSEFMPPRTGVMGYLGFNGDLFIDMYVRQKAVRSISSNLSMKVRGTWQEPEITIK